MSAHDDARAFRAARRASRFIFSNPASIMTAVSRGVFAGGHRRGARTRPASRRATAGGRGARRRGLRVGAIEIHLREDPVSALATGIVVEEDGLPVSLAFPPRKQTRAERSDMLDAVKPGKQRFTGVEDLEMRRARDVMGVADLDHRSALASGRRK